MVGRDRQGAVVSYFHGPARTWKTGVPTFAGLVYPDLWPGIDLLYRGTTDRLKYAFEVAPGADPSCIRLRYRGVDAVTRTADGALEVRTPAGSFRDETPVAWQQIDGRRVPVAAAYAVGEHGVIGFTIGDYDRRRPLVLDPAILVHCGFVGGLVRCVRSQYGAYGVRTETAR